MAKSAPEKPGVPRATVLISTSEDIGTFLVCTFKIFSLPIISGFGTTTCLSNLPGLNKAGSKTSGLFVAAIKIMPSFVSKPSISTRSWLRVCSLSSLPPPKPAPLWRPTASISSIKIIHGAFFLACSNISLTRLAPTPTNISTKSEPDIVKKGTFASPAIALAKRVFPVPGGPTNNAPLGIFPPSLWNLDGSFKNSTISCKSSFASSTPATSSKVTIPFFSLSNFAFDFPKPIAFPPPPCICLIKNIHTAIKRSIGNHEIRTPNKVGPPSLVGFAFITTPLSYSLCIKVGSEGAKVEKPLPSEKWPDIESPDISTSVTLPLSTSASNWEKLISDCIGPVIGPWTKLYNPNNEKAKIAQTKKFFKLPLFNLHLSKNFYLYMLV